MSVHTCQLGEGAYLNGVGSIERLATMALEALMDVVSLGCLAMLSDEGIDVVKYGQKARFKLPIVQHVVAGYPDTHREVPPPDSENA